MNVLDFAKRKSAGEKISMVTCYDRRFGAIVVDYGDHTVRLIDNVAARKASL